MRDHRTTRALNSALRLCDRRTRPVLVGCVLAGVVACGSDSKTPTDPGQPPITGPVIAFVAALPNVPKGLWITDPAGRNLQQLTADTLAIQRPAWSPDGASLAFMITARDHTDIDVVNANGSGRMTIANGRTRNADPSWSPDGQRLAFAGGPFGRDTIFVMNRDGTNVSILTGSEWDDGEPAWSPNGQRIAFTSLRDPAVNNTRWRRLFLMNADGSNVQRVAPDNDLVAFSPAWSPDGTQLAFEAHSPAGQTHIYIYRLSTSAVRQLTSASEEDHRPTWSPDGARIVFSRVSAAAGVHLFSIAVDGSDTRQITTGATSDVDPAFRPIP